MTAEPAPVPTRPDPGAIVELDPVLRAYLRRHPRGSSDLIYKAYDVAARSHEGQFRKSGEPFITHPLTVAQILAAVGLALAGVGATRAIDAIGQRAERPPKESGPEGGRPGDDGHREPVPRVCFFDGTQRGASGRVLEAIS